MAARAVNRLDAERLEAAAIIANYPSQDYYYSKQSTSTSNPTPFIPKSQTEMSTIPDIQGVEHTAKLEWRAPSPPHINVPAASEEFPIEIPPVVGTQYCCSMSEDERSILRVIAQTETFPSAVNDWQYEKRRRAQPILEFLHLGPSAAARDIEYVRSNQITLLLAVRNSATAQARLLSGEKVANQLGIQAAAVDLHGMQDLISMGFSQAIKIINDHLIAMYRLQASGSQKHPGKVLVFCESGNERSSAVVAAYMMFMYGMEFIPVIQYIQTQRFCVAFDDAVKELFLTYQGLLDAQSGVMMAAIAAPPRQAAKRGRERSHSIEEDGMDVDYPDDDEERFENRAGFVPFRDRTA
ncbi:hypothetical protein HYFRA_00002412 [Hymenoscyphus fraxineus]|uniref:Tyrosine specific protein phosphatases domain-containing protein n=1 Tax=Hymenoscyphus fraxineus TaxID=746836 RepID=A0A9N9PYY9_9HELO|nr:hypothetical protein HYFRA_00002412 [Hymenoscyphus fraxineus]